MHDPLDDTVEVAGLSPLFEDDDTLAYLDLRLRSGGRQYRAALLRAGEEWTVNVRDERGKALTGSGELYPSAGDAVLAALGLSLEVGRRRALRESQEG